MLYRYILSNINYSHESNNIKRSISCFIHKSMYGKNTVILVINNNNFVDSILKLNK